MKFIVNIGIAAYTETEGRHPNSAKITIPVCADKTGFTIEVDCGEKDTVSQIQTLLEKMRLACE